jgi:urease alpha subunit
MTTANGEAVQPNSLSVRSTRGRSTTGAPPGAGRGTLETQVGSDVVTLDANGTAAISFPAPFGAGVIGVIASNGDATAQAAIVSVAATTTTGFQVHVDYGPTAAPVTGQFRVNWIAIGG